MIKETPLVPDLNSGHAGRFFFGSLRNVNKSRYYIKYNQFMKQATVTLIWYHIFTYCSIIRTYTITKHDFDNKNKFLKFQENFNKPKVKFQ